ncbi:MAG: iron(III) transport system substrate-binding protein [Phycisphaerales bacterium]|jgi:ABC-type Fe3+ transport system substrate-binding protein|nr:iron(III) transport system substrate-binding protein [Phycisphaerales bacterium]
MKRYGWIVLFLVVLLTPFVLRAFVGGGEAEATPEPPGKSLRLVVVTPHAEPIRSEFADAFSRWHQEKFGQPVFVDYRIYGGASDITRYFESARETLYKSLGTYQIDIVWGGGDDLFERQLSEPGHLAGVRLPDDVMKRAFAQPTIGNLPLYDPKNDPPRWFGTALSSFGIVYNRDVLKHLDLPEPQTWADLADPKYRGWIVLADPLRSGVARTSFMVIVERAMADAVEQGRSPDEGWARGMGLIRQIAANARNFTDSGTVVPSIVGTGEAAAAMAIDFQARSQVDAIVASGNSARLAYIEPPRATAINPDPIALVQGAEHRDVAVHFIEFVLSEEGQRLWNTRAGAPGGPKKTSLRRLPIMKSVYDDPRDFTDKVNPYESSGGFNTSRERTKTFSIIGELIQMSCIDLLDDLRETRAKLLASSRSKELDAKLGIFPFDQQEALRRMQIWSKSTPLERLALQRQWTAEFRAEYASLRKMAENGTTDAHR